MLLSFGFVMKIVGLFHLGYAFFFFFFLPPKCINLFCFSNNEFSNLPFQFSFAIPLGE